MNTMTAKPETQADVLEQCRAIQGMSKAEFAHALDMSEAAYESFLRVELETDIEELKYAAIAYVETWVGDLAVRLLEARGAIVPCICKTGPGDNGHCPKHGLFCDGGEGQWEAS